MDSIILTGLRATGKTEKGEFLSDKTGFKLVDGDTLIKIRLRELDYESIAQFVEDQGWPGFRKIETESIEDLCNESSEDQIIFTPGGGAVAHDQGEEYRLRNVTLLQIMGTIAHIVPYDDGAHTSAELSYRIVNDSDSVNTRPKLTDVKLEDIEKQTVREYLASIIMDYVDFKETGETFPLLKSIKMRHIGKIENVKNPYEIEKAFEMFSEDKVLDRYVKNLLICMQHL